MKILWLVASSFLHLLKTKIWILLFKYKVAKWSVNVNLGSTAIGPAFRD
jgi:hypothetical protein